MHCLPLARGKLLLLLRLLENLLDDLLLLNQEGADNAVLDAVTASGTTVGARDVLLGTRNLGVFTGSESRNLREDTLSGFSIKANHIAKPQYLIIPDSSSITPTNTIRYLVEWQQHKRFSRVELTPGSLIPQSPHLGAVPFFLMCRYRRLPPGVLMMRTLLDLVLYLFMKLPY
jgi:hypothetical protein